MEVERRVGVDLGLRGQHQAVVYDGVVRQGRAFAVKVSREGFDELLRRATEGSEGPVTFVMEPTGNAWVTLAAYVAAAGHRVKLAKPQKVSDLRKFYRKHTKTDVIDAEALARLPEVDGDGVRDLAVPTAKQMSLRRLVKRRERLCRQVAAQKQRVEALLKLVNPFVLDAVGEDKFSCAAVVFYRKCADADVVVRRGCPTLRRFWKRHSQGKADEDRADKVYEACRKTSELYRKLRQLGRLPFDYVDVQEELSADLDLIETLQADAHRLEARIKEMYLKVDPDRTLEQLRGVGTTIAASIEALVGDVGRFPNGRHFVGYCGYCPRKRKSGQTDPRLPITKAGHRLLKKYLYLAAEVARQWDPDFAAYYARRYAQGDHHNRIMIILAHKMALRIYALLKRREAAREANAEGREPASTAYILRDADGREVTKKQARQLIVQKYARAVVAPEREARDRAKKGKPQRTVPGKNEWPSKDATTGTTAAAAKTEISHNSADRQASSAR